MLVSYDRGSLLVRDAEPGLLLALPEAREDRRVGALRLPAHRYHHLVRQIVARDLPFEDQAKAYQVLEPGPDTGPPARAYQEEALLAWRQAGRRGLVVLPTGSGKTRVAELAIRDARRSTLVVVPTLDLLNQWYELLGTRFGDERVGAIGGGTFEPKELTVITYDSAYLHLERLGDRFGLIIFDEVHHLAGPSYLQAARMSLAPFRLGLTATPPEGERLVLTEQLVGPRVFARQITDLAGDFLSSYETIRIKAALSEAERARYEAARAHYRGFVEERGIRLGGRYGWSNFLVATSRSAEGRAAFFAWREQRRIAMATPAKLDHLERILERHADERVLVFTHDNEAAFAVSRRFLVPSITHQTRPKERRALLRGLEDASLPVLVTSRVLNEGVNVPSVSVGVVLSGTATVREHVQRLGRILRKVEGKHAVLYEIVSEGTSEEAASKRRRDHDAYR